MCVTDTDAKSYPKKEPAKVMEQHEKETGQVPSELFENVEGFYTNGLLVCGWDRGTRGSEHGEEACHSTGRQGEVGQVPSELFGNAEGFYTNGLLVCGWDRGTRGSERGGEACHSTGRQVEP